jgi:hypothetical protein
MNPYLVSNKLCVRNKGDKFQEMGIRVPLRSVNNPFKLYLMNNSKSVMNKSLVYEDETKNKDIIYSPLNKSQLNLIELTIKQSNAIDGSVYYFNMNMIENRLNIDNRQEQVLSIDLNPFKKKYNTPEKFNQFLKNLHKASINILS